MWCSYSALNIYDTSPVHFMIIIINQKHEFWFLVVTAYTILTMQNKTARTIPNMNERDEAKPNSHLKVTTSIYMSVNKPIDLDNFPWDRVCNTSRNASG